MNSRGGCDMLNSNLSYKVLTYITSTHIKSISLLFRRESLFANLPRLICGSSTAERTGSRVTCFPRPVVVCA
jgi:hypothetical protein